MALFNPRQTAFCFAFARCVPVVLGVSHVQHSLANRAFFDSAPIGSPVLFFHLGNQRERCFKIPNCGFYSGFIFGNLIGGWLQVFVTSSFFGECLLLLRAWIVPKHQTVAGFPKSGAGSIRLWCDITVTNSGLACLVAPVSVVMNASSGSHR